jgi:hypothetical protein
MGSEADLPLIRLRRKCGAEQGLWPAIGSDHTLVESTLRQHHHYSDRPDAAWLGFGARLKKCLVSMELRGAVAKCRLPLASYIDGVRILNGK